MAQTNKSSFSSRRSLKVGNDEFQMFDINVLAPKYDVRPITSLVKGAAREFTPQ